ncbi:CHAT domain-containing protein [Trichoderma sp. SZMC 28012]
MEEFHIDPELLSSLHEASEQDLQVLAELHEDPANDDQIELYIYLCFLIFQKSCNTQSLEQAIQRAEGWAAATAASHPDHDRRHSIMDTLVAWGHQYRTIEENVMDELAPLLLREPAANKLDFPIRLQGEANRLVESFEQSGRLEHLKQGIEKIELAISIAGEYTTPSMLNTFGAMLGSRSMKTGSMDDLDQAITVLSDAVDATPQNHPDRSTCLSNLGNQMLQRFERKGSIEDLNRAISLHSEAVDATPRDHPDRAYKLNNFGICLTTRYTFTGSIDDIDRAVDTVREAVNLTPHGHPSRARHSTVFGATLGSRFLRTGSMDDLNQAIRIVSEVIDDMPHDHPEHTTILSNLGYLVSMRFKQTGSTDDMTQAISIYNKVVDSTPYNAPDRATHLDNLGASLLERFQQTRSEDDYNQAMRLSSEAVDLTPLDNPHRAFRLTNLAHCISMQCKQTKSSNNLDHLIPLATTAWQSETSPPHERIRTAHALALMLILKGHWEESSQLLQEGISLLHTVSPRFSNRADAQALISASIGLASTAASAALKAGKAPEDALRLLEQGRGIIASLLMDMRGDISNLQRQCPDLAEKFGLLRDELDMPNNNTISLTATSEVSLWELQRKRRHELNNEFSEVIDIIRAQPGFSNFLQPPDVKELMGAAEQGPIIVLNTCTYANRSDAFLIQPDSIQLINLPSLKHDEVQHRVAGLLANSDLSPLLEWLWHTICHPCLNALGITDAVSDDNWPHIWWIPTGVLSQLPLHAAGIYKQGSKETVLDRAVSSYASSIKALLHGRKHGIQKHRPSPSEDSALIVSMKETPGLEGKGCLPFASKEVHMLEELCPKLQLASSTPSQNKKEDVLKHMPKCKIFHFAGHGQSDPMDPSQSCLLLEDWETNPLTVGDIRDSRLQDDPPFLAYLSACSTGANKMERLADEGIHLISAFQLAGFRHAIGTLWEVSDKHCVDVARILYKTLQEEGMTDLAVSRGLHRAIRALRDGNADDGLTRDAKLKLVRPRPASQGMTDFFWVPYVHFGV